MGLSKLLQRLVRFLMDGREAKNKERYAPKHYYEHLSRYLMGRQYTHQDIWFHTEKIFVFTVTKCKIEMHLNENMEYHYSLHVFVDMNEIHGNPAVPCSAVAMQIMKVAIKYFHPYISLQSFPDKNTVKRWNAWLKNFQDKILDVVREVLLQKI
jgi:hypothetical protein